MLARTCVSTTKMAYREGKVAEPDDMRFTPDQFVRRDGLRLVKPYYFDFICNVKKRWIGRNIIDVFSQEFPARDQGYYEIAVKDGRLRADKGSVGAGSMLRNGQVLRHFVHRHEPPVLDSPVPVLGQTDKLVAVGKPATVPVHVSGQYRKNTVLGILQAEQPGLGTLLPAHRLDKSVSGVLLFARNAAAADELRLIIQGRDVEKVYMARVMGVFPEGDTTADIPLAWDARANHAFPVGTGSGGSAAAAAAAADRKAHTTNTVTEPKEAVTKFRRVAVAPDGKTSLVECRPLTGRTHQIRVHLQYVGHPIANDNQYGGTYPGPLRPTTAQAAERDPADPANPAAKRQRTCNGAQALGGLGVTGSAGSIATPTAAAAIPSSLHDGGSCAATLAAHTCVVSEDAPCSNKQPSTSPSNTELPGCSVAQTSTTGFASTSYLVDAELVDPLCLHCPSMVPEGYPTTLRPMWLHALRYSSHAWCFECPAADWANEDWSPLS